MWGPRTSTGKIQNRTLSSLGELCYTKAARSHFEIEGGWSSNGNEEGSSKETCKEKEVVAS